MCGPPRQETYRTSSDARESVVSTQRGEGPSKEASNSATVGHRGARLPSKKERFSIEHNNIGASLSTLAYLAPPAGTQSGYRECDRVSPNCVCVCTNDVSTANASKHQHLHGEYVHRWPSSRYDRLARTPSSGDACRVDDLVHWVMILHEVLGDLSGASYRESEHEQVQLAIRRSSFLSCRRLEPLHQIR